MAHQVFSVLLHDAFVASLFFGLISAVVFRVVLGYTAHFQQLIFTSGDALHAPQPPTADSPKRPSSASHCTIAAIRSVRGRCPGQAGGRQVDIHAAKVMARDRHPAGRQP